MPGELPGFKQFPVGRFYCLTSPDKPIKCIDHIFSNVSYACHPTKGPVSPSFSTGETDTAVVERARR